MPRGIYIRSEEHNRNIGLARMGKRTHSVLDVIGEGIYIGQVRRTLKSNGHYSYQKWLACVDCGKARWTELVSIKSNKSRYMRCPICSGKRATRNQIGENNPVWKGGWIKDVAGYIRVKVYPDDFFYPMAIGNNYVMEHRLVMAKHINRCLLSWEIVHHKNHIRDDNRLENLQLLPTSRQHTPTPRWRYELAKRDKLISQLEARITLLEAENILLKNETPSVRF
uniref:Putative homing endonuclease n=1 Tax=viral metagenome TaxID=1070528 RepID=A0A6M3L764_9ZZZZ